VLGSYRCGYLEDRKWQIFAVNSCNIFATDIRLLGPVLGFDPPRSFPCKELADFNNEQKQYETLYAKLTALKLEKKLGRKTCSDLII
jgi:hypothetical protein